MNNGCQHSCVNEVGSYSCACDRGFILADGGFMCLDVDECSVLHNGFCSQLCINTEGSYHCDCRPGSYHCSCPDGFLLDEDGITCHDVDECQCMNNGCQHSCVNEVGSYSCACDRGFILADDGVTCLDVDECSALPNGFCSQLCIRRQIMAAVRSAQTLLDLTTATANVVSRWSVKQNVKM
jgi:fibulin 1/2